MPERFLSLPLLAFLCSPFALAGCGPAPVEVILRKAHRTAVTPVADNRPANPQTVATSNTSTGPQAITFEDLDIGMQPDSVYEPWMLTTRVQEIEGRSVRITGFMSAAILQAGENIRTFPLMREKECPFGPGGQAHHVIEVELQGHLRTSFTTEPVTVTGRLTVRPWKGANGKTWSLYHLEGTKIE